MNEDGSDQTLEKSASKPVAETNRKLVAPVAAVAEEFIKPSSTAEVSPTNLSALKGVPAQPADVAPGYVRLYRGQSEEFEPVPSGRLSRTGRIFTTRLEGAKQYATGPEGRVYYVDVPAKIVQASLSPEGYKGGFLASYEGGYRPHGQTPDNSSEIVGTLNHQYANQITMLPMPPVDQSLHPEQSQVAKAAPAPRLPVTEPNAGKQTTPGK